MLKIETVENDLNLLRRAADAQASRLGIERAGAIADLIARADAGLQGAKENPLQEQAYLDRAYRAQARAWMRIQGVVK
jgi:hypothetical protein